jgi:hypothetical protein
VESEPLAAEPAAQTVAPQTVAPVPTAPLAAPQQSLPTRTEPTWTPDASPAVAARSSVTFVVAPPMIVATNASHRSGLPAEAAVPVMTPLTRHVPAVTSEVPRVAAPALSPAPPAAPPQPLATPLPEPPPTISIGTVEVVMALPPQRPAPAVPARPAPDRGFSRYAAIRSGRDRVW